MNGVDPAGTKDFVDYFNEAMSWWNTINNGSGNFSFKKQVDEDAYFAQRDIGSGGATAVSEISTRDAHIEIMAKQCAAVNFVLLLASLSDGYGEAAILEGGLDSGTVVY